MAPQDSQNCGRNFAKRKQSDAEFAGNTTHGYIIDTVINTILDRLTLDPAAMHCPSWDDAFDSSYIWDRYWSSPITPNVHVYFSINRTTFSALYSLLFLLK